MTLRLVIASPDLDDAGPHRVLTELITGLDRSRFDPVLLVGHGGGRYFDAVEATLPVEIIGGGRYPVRRFAAAIDQVRPDLVFTTLRMNPTALAARYLQRYRPPVIIRQANAMSVDYARLRNQSLIKHRLAEWGAKRLMRTADRIVAQSEEMAAEVRSVTRGKVPVQAIGNPISVEQTRAAAERQRAASGFEAPPGAPALISVGRLSYQKGYDLLLSAFANILTDHPGAVLTIRGEGEDRASLEKQARDLGIDRSVRLPGTSATVLAEIAAADLFVSSSRYEGFSNAMLEAMALDTPVAATDCPGASRDMIIDGRTGMLASSVDADAIAAAVRRVLSADRAAIAAAARKHVVRAYDKAAIVRAYEELFEDVAAGS
ncbi:glycosyltransferase [Sphingomicrobium sp. XHP0239]|uniref:glycosyltransferase n=1 Tax=Sphingomicrobium maritimum TaxID=3133972 RepID=UPI0031CCCB98